jgi:hypothetical protein
MAVNMRNQAAQRTLKLDIVRAIACVGTLTSRGRGKQIFTRRGRIAARGLFGLSRFSGKEIEIILF